ncbi:hypothetical protein [Methanobrevibacter sp.]|uniref:hypothetical protein n=1 Tax=Methanobrevibacter sp. TaxID=66852 RepID=UPI0025D5FE6E|nr:hypothetical protein [Methanobrevibacter sp.]MBR4448366.1 hypothetical protein [Methanobrevibacter sp.]
MNVFDWKKNADVGVHLMSFSNKEEYQRSSISRFYYSCFGPSKEYYEESFRRILSRNNPHATLITELKNSPFIEEQQLGKKLKKLRSQRNRADYSEKSQDFPVAESKRIVEDIFKLLDELKSHPLRIMKR